MTSACLTLLHGAQCPIWRWDRADTPGLQVEAFPAAQLCHWELPYERYGQDGYDALSIRRKIVDFLSKHIALAPFRGTMRG